MAECWTIHLGRQKILHLADNFKCLFYLADNENKVLHLADSKDCQQTRSLLQLADTFEQDCTWQTPSLCHCCTWQTTFGTRVPLGRIPSVSFWQKDVVFSLADSNVCIWQTDLKLYSTWQTITTGHCTWQTAKIWGSAYSFWQTSRYFTWQTITNWHCTWQTAKMGCSAHSSCKVPYLFKIVCQVQHLCKIVCQGK